MHTIASPLKVVSQDERAAHESPASIHSEPVFSTPLCEKKWRRHYYRLMVRLKSTVRWRGCAFSGRRQQRPRATVSVQALVSCSTIHTCRLSEQTSQRYGVAVQGFRHKYMAAVSNSQHLEIQGSKAGQNLDYSSSRRTMRKNQNSRR